MIRRACPLIIGAALTCMLDPLAVSAQENSPHRVGEFANTPNWAGLWETDIAADSAGIERESEQAIHSARGGGSSSARRPSTASAAGSLTGATGSTQPPAGPTDPGVVEAAFIRRIKLLGPPPYNAEWERKYRSELKNGARPTGPPFSGACATTFPAIMENPTEEGMFEPLVTPEEVVLVFAGGSVRHIYTDGRSHPRREDLWPTDMGDSVGRWEGQALVIDTIARKPGRLVPELPLPMVDFSDQAHFVERLQLLDHDTMEDDLTIEDPPRFAHPWHVAIRYKRVKDLDRMIMVNCSENNRNAVVNGRMVILPP